MRRLLHAIVLGCLVEGLLAALLVRLSNAPDSAIRTIVLVMHLPGLLVTSMIFNLGNGDHIVPAALTMLGLWVLFFHRLQAFLKGTDRQRPVTSKGLQIIAVVAMLGVAAVLFIQRFGPFPRQMENMAAAEEHISILGPTLRQDARFTNVTLHAFTGSGGSLSISGELPSEQDLADLKQIIEKSKPPVEVVYNVFVVPPELQRGREMQETRNGRIRN